MISGVETDGKGSNSIDAGGTSGLPASRTQKKLRVPRMNTLGVMCCVKRSQVDLFPKERSPVGSLGSHVGYLSGYRTTERGVLRSRTMFQ